MRFAHADKIMYATRSLHAPVCDGNMLGRFAQRNAQMLRTCGQITSSDMLFNVWQSSSVGLQGLCTPFPHLIGAVQSCVRRRCARLIRAASAALSPTSAAAGGQRGAAGAGAGHRDRGEQAEAHGAHHHRAGTPLLPFVFSGLLGYHQITVLPVHQHACARVLCVMACRSARHVPQCCLKQASWWTTLQLV